MRHEFVDCYAKLGRKSATLRDIYNFLIHVGIQKTAQRMQAVDDRLRAILLQADAH
jgi:hypothetical protein